MMKKTLFLMLLLLSTGIIIAQEKLSKEEKERREKNIRAGNPFTKFGSKAPVATLSKGKYLEVHDLDSIVTIGTIRWHVENQKIVGRLIRDKTDPDAQPIGDVAGRWMSPDPLSEEFPSWSPYNFVMNNPLRMVDPDGRAPDDIIIKGKNNSSLTIKTDAIDLTLNSDRDFKGNHTITDVTNLAIGSQISGTATAVAGTGTSGSVSKISTMFLGNEHAGYWYDYVGVEGQVIGATGFEVSAGVGKSWFLAVNDPKVKNTNNPEAFAGNYIGGGIAGSYEPLIGKIALNGQMSQATDKSWKVYALGASVAVGPSGGIFAGVSGSVESHMGTTKLMTPQVKTKDRSWADILINWTQKIITP